MFYVLHVAPCLKDCNPSFALHADPLSTPSGRVGNFRVPLSSLGRTIWAGNPVHRGECSNLFMKSQLMFRLVLIGEAYRILPTPGQMRL